jgi:iron-sulfur cluster repair protein YtfE (RIC family)
VAVDFTLLHQEHQELEGGLARLKETAELVDLASVENVVLELEEAYQFLSRHLVPHARAEEDVLYRAYDQVANSPWATDTLRRDHAEIQRLTQELLGLRLQLYTDPLTVEQKHETRRILLSLYAVLRLHFSHEEQLLLPRLSEAISQEAADQLVASMERAEETYRAATV